MTKNFKRQEFFCKCGCSIPDRIQSNVWALAQELQVLRDEVKKPIKIMSGYRCKTHNTKVGGAKQSQHMTGRAADIIVEGMDSSEVADTIETLISVGRMREGGLGRYAGFTHYDIRGAKARWQR